MLTNVSTQKKRQIESNSWLHRFINSHPENGTILDTITLSRNTSRRRSAHNLGSFLFQNNHRIVFISKHSQKANRPIPNKLTTILISANWEWTMQSIPWGPWANSIIHSKQSKIFSSKQDYPFHLFYYFSFFHFQFTKIAWYYTAQNTVIIIAVIRC